MKYALTFGNRSRYVKEFDNFFGDFFEDFNKSLSIFDKVFEENKLEIKEEKDKYSIDLELEGFKKKEIDVSVDNNILYIKAESKDETKDKKESAYKSYSRVLYLSDDVDTENINASYKKGKLSIELAKDLEKEKIKKIDIK